MALYKTKLTGEDLDNVNGGYLYQGGSKDGYHIHVIDDQTGEEVGWYYHFEIEDAEDWARNTNNSIKWISDEELNALREKNKK